MNHFYEKNHKQYFESTVGIEPTSFLTPLVKLLKPKATILDIGCGSGRDLAWFAERGFKPTGLEISSGLAALARNHSKQPVIEADFTTYDFSAQPFDALVFVGALVHIPKQQVPVILQSTCRALRHNALILLTLKEGSGVSCSDDGRVFTLWSPNELEFIFKNNNLKILNFSRQVSKLCPDDIWLGYVLKLDDE